MKHSRTMLSLVAAWRIAVCLAFSAIPALIVRDLLPVHYPLARWALLIAAIFLGIAWHMAEPVQVAYATRKRTPRI